MYWKNSGPQNTEATLQAALNAAQDRGILHIVIASTSGTTALSLAKRTSGLHIVCISQAYGSAEPGINEMPEETRNCLKNMGLEVFSTTHALSAAERGISSRFGGACPVEIVAHSLRMLGHGVKVCAEISIMALDGGLIPFGEDIIAIAGTGQGADTAVIIRPAHANNLFDTNIKEIICKPLQP